MRTPVQLMDALGLSAAVDGEGLASRSLGYDYVHVGMQDTYIGTLVDVLTEERELRPPRTGHLGNWEDIALGRAGAMDFNQAVCARDLGYPLIGCFTQTEADGSSGDWVYLPGSVVERGTRTPLPLCTWDGRRFVQRTRERPLFCPFVQTELDGSLVPLVEVHWNRMQSISGFKFRTEAQVIAEHAQMLRPMLALLLEEAAQHDNPRRAFQDLISHAAAPDGSVARCELRREGPGCWLDDCYYSSTAELVDAALIPFSAVSQPRAFFEHMAELPTRVPIMSHLLIGVFSGILATHYPDAEGVTRPFNAHLHWGARDMAGYPPRRKGYFVEKSTTRSLRRICGALVREFPEVDPLCIVLLPAAVFMLCPSSAFPGDAEVLSGLFHQVSNAVPDAVEPLARTWLASHADRLSDYFVNRFTPRRGVMHVGDLPAGGAPLEPDGFQDLTFRQACTIVGSLYSAFDSEVAA